MHGHEFAHKWVQHIIQNPVIEGPAHIGQGFKMRPEHGGDLRRLFLQRQSGVDQSLPTSPPHEIGQIGNRVDAGTHHNAAWFRKRSQTAQHGAGIKLQR